MLLNAISFFVSFFKEDVLFVCLFVYWFIYLLTQPGFYGNYAADVGLRPTASFLEGYRVLIQIGWKLSKLSFTFRLFYFKYVKLMLFKGAVYW